MHGGQPPNPTARRSLSGTTPLHPFTMNWINPAYSSLMITKRLICFQDQKDKELFEKVITLWQGADQSRDNPRELCRLFGEGLALFGSLPEYIRYLELSPGLSAYGVYVRSALAEVCGIANKNRISVNFGTEGAIFH
jgi:hypothetical protein